MSSAVRVTEDGSTVITEDLLKLASGAFEVSIIQSLNLSHLKIKTVQNLDRCESLTVLDLSHNDLFTFGSAPTSNASSIPVASTTLPAGTTILTSSSITPIPTSHPLANIAQTLKILNLSHNKLESIASLAYFKKLEQLRLQGNMLESLELDVLQPLQQLPNLKTLMLQQMSEDGQTIVATNPVCTKTPRKEYVKVLSTSFPKLRCLDGHYFNKELEDPFIRENAVDDAFANYQLPPSRPWLSEAQVKVSEFDPTTAGKAGEKMLQAALLEAKKVLANATV